jgi:hypothetical protein
LFDGHTANLQNRIERELVGRLNLYFNYFLNLQNRIERGWLASAANFFTSVGIYKIELKE